MWQIIGNIESFNSDDTPAAPDDIIPTRDDIEDPSAQYFTDPNDFSIARKEIIFSQVINGEEISRIKLVKQADGKIEFIMIPNHTELFEDFINRTDLNVVEVVHTYPSTRLDNYYRLSIQSILQTSNDQKWNEFIDDLQTHFGEEFILVKQVLDQLEIGELPTEAKEIYKQLDETDLIDDESNLTQQALLLLGRIEHYQSSLEESIRGVDNKMYQFLRKVMQSPSEDIGTKSQLLVELCEKIKDSNFYHRACSECAEYVYFYLFVPYKLSLKEHGRELSEEGEQQLKEILELIMKLAFISNMWKIIGNIESFNSEDTPVAPDGIIPTRDDIEDPSAQYFTDPNDFSIARKEIIFSQVINEEEIPTIKLVKQTDGKIEFIMIPNSTERFKDFIDRPDLNIVHVVVHERPGTTRYDYYRLSIPSILETANDQKWNEFIDDLQTHFGEEFILVKQVLAQLEIGEFPTEAKEIYKQLDEADLIDDESNLTHQARLLLGRIENYQSSIEESNRDVDNKMYQFLRKVMQSPSEDIGTKSQLLVELCQKIKDSSFYHRACSECAEYVYFSLFVPYKLSLKEHDRELSEEDEQQLKEILEVIMKLAIIGVVDGGDTIESCYLTYFLAQFNLSSDFLDASSEEILEFKRCFFLESLHTANDFEFQVFASNIASINVLAINLGKRRLKIEKSRTAAEKEREGLILTAACVENPQLVLDETPKFSVLSLKPS